ncbi:MULTISPECIES: hypothetical protein [unclassified Pyramidobacter]|uniref:hypothetical protein n=1 Tax=unclassified Pyramidobacter TaxID=2632171 RepID=UPI000EA0BC7C|nr:hypothetical protein [Pyramidobacter sp. CG50-2]RKJ79364.1 hypothetical protein D7D26_05060 [Pyramidobacter sp. CG50-2]
MKDSDLRNERRDDHGAADLPLTAQEKETTQADAQEKAERRDGHGAADLPLTAQEKENTQADAQEKNSPRPSGTKLKRALAAAAIALLGAGLYWGYSWRQQKEAERIALQKQQEQQRLQEEKRRTEQARLLDRTARQVTARGLEGEDRRPSLFAAAEISDSKSWKLLAPLFGADRPKIPDGPFKVRLWSSDKIAVSTETLKKLFADLLRGEYVPGMLPMIYRDGWTEALDRFQRQLAESAQSAGPLLSETDEDRLRQEVRTVLEKPGGKEYFAFVWEKDGGCLKIRFVDQKGDVVYDRCYLPEGSFILSDDALSYWILRLKGSLKIEPWIEPADNGQIVLHGRNLPGWSRENRENVTDQFISELVNSLEGSIQ